MPQVCVIAIVGNFDNYRFVIRDGKNKRFYCGPMAGSMPQVWVIGIDMSLVGNCNIYLWGRCPKCG